MWDTCCLPSKWYNIIYLLRPLLINERINDVDEFYSTEKLERKIQLVNKYNIDLIIIGELEKNKYPEKGIKALEGLELQNYFEVIYENEETEILKVRKLQIVSKEVLKIDFFSKILNNDREVYVWIPENYNLTNKKYPLLIAHDGGAVFYSFYFFWGFSIF